MQQEIPAKVKRLRTGVSGEKVEQGIEFVIKKGSRIDIERAKGWCKGTTYYHVHFCVFESSQSIKLGRDNQGVAADDKA